MKEKLEPRSVVEMAATAACKDGQIEPREAFLIKKVGEGLGLAGKEIEECFEVAREAAGSQEEREAADPEELYEEACRLALADGWIQSDEHDVLEKLAEVLNLEKDWAEQILENVRKADG